MKNLFFSFLIICAAADLSQAQTPELLLEKIRADYTREKIFVHYDKSAYSAGETIWYKIYITEGMTTSLKSTVVKMELINDSGRIITYKILPVVAGTASGSMEIPVELPTGSYRVRCFTRRMMNFGSDIFYTRSINIYNENLKGAAGNETNDALVYFLPEGGNMVTGVQNTVAFKCIDKQGIPLKAEGEVKNSAGKTVLSFRSVHDGMGKFDLTPVPGERYTADCIINGSLKKSFVLPVAQPEAVVLRVKRTGSVVRFEADASTVLNKQLYPAYILGVEENTVAFKVPFPSDKKILTGIIPEAQLPSGILQLTVFTEDHKHLAERLFLNNSGDFRAEGNFRTGKADLAAKAKNEFSYELTDTLVGSYSVAVTDATLEMPGERPDNIWSGLLLSAELKGRIYDPSYYFESNDATHAENLDLVMLTNGWRRYSWNEIFINRFPAMTFKDPDYISTSGIAYGNNAAPLVNEQLAIHVKTLDDQSDFVFVPTGPRGDFALQGLMFEGNARFSLRSNIGKKKGAYVNVTPVYLSEMFKVAGNLPQLPAYKEPGEADKTAIAKAYTFSRNGGGRGILLNTVEIKVKKKTALQELKKKYETGMLGGNARTSLDLISDPPTGGYYNILEYLRTKISGVKISGGPINNYQVNYRGMMNVVSGAVPMNIFVDDVQVDADYAAAIPATQVALVSVYSSGAIAGAGGALAIYTRKGTDYKVPEYNPLSSFELEGFSPVKEFFSPDYEKNAAEIKEDNRITLYWNPHLNTDAVQKKFSFSFFNSGRANKIRVVLEGILEDGRMVHIEKLIE